jgi:hypothetical protein
MMMRIQIRDLGSAGRANSKKMLMTMMIRLLQLPIKMALRSGNPSRN